MGPVEEATASFLSVKISVEIPYEAVMANDEAAEKPTGRDRDNGERGEREEVVLGDGTNTL